MATASRRRRRWLFPLHVAGVVITLAAGARGAVPERPDPRTPIATDGQLVYAVAGDHETLLRSRPGDRAWQVFTRLSGSDVRGLVWWGGSLYVSDAKRRAILAVSTTARDRSPEVIHQGAPLQRPADLTFARALLVVDFQANAIFRIPLEGPNSPVTRLALAPDISLDEDTSIAGGPSGELLISNGDAGAIAQVTGLATPDATRLWTMQSRLPDSASPVSRSEKSEYGMVTAVRKQGYPGVERPGAVATFNGVVYVVEAATGRVFAAGIHDARTIRLPLDGSDGMQLTRLLATKYDLLAFDVTTGRAVSWPRLVPAEIRVLSESAKEPLLSNPRANPRPDVSKDQLAHVYEYLLERHLLASRAVRVTAGANNRIGEDRWWPGDAITDLATTPRLNTVLCQLNAQLCSGGRLSASLESGTVVRVPDVYAERFLAPDRVTLTGSRSLGEVVDEAIVSDEFSAFRSDKQLLEVNGVYQISARPREWRTGSFRISREQVRYLAAFEAAELDRLNSPLRRLIDETKGAVSISPVERVLTLAASAHDQSHPNDPDCVLARKAFEQLLQTIKYVPITARRGVTVGVAETGIDPGHPDLQDANGSIFLHAPVAEIAPAPVGPAGEGGAEEPVTWRRFEDDDHATAIVSLIAARWRPFTSTKGLTNARIAMLDHPRDATALAHDIEDANAQTNITVINLSLKPLAESPALWTAIDASKATTLYVVSAPNLNSAMTLCSAEARVYPACWGADHDNLLVVGATSLDGTAIHERSPIGAAIHLFAPGGGYFAAGKRRGYVEVTGTSFATALVSAAAAMLSATEVNDPGEIRRRLIATADLMLLPNRPEWARRLNIQRALSHLRHSVVTDANTKKETVIEPTKLDQVVSFRRVGSTNPLPLAVWQILRLTRDPQNAAQFRLAYVDADLKLRLLTVRAPADAWSFCYQLVGDDNQVMGPERCGDLAEFGDYVGPVR